MRASVSLSTPSSGRAGLCEERLPFVRLIGRIGVRIRSAGSILLLRSRWLARLRSSVGLLVRRLIKTRLRDRKILQRKEETM